MSVDIDKLTALANIALSDIEKARYKGEAERVVSQWECIANLQCEDSPSAHPYVLECTTRRDVPLAPLPREELFKNAKSADGEGFLVPRVLD